MYIPFQLESEAPVDQVSLLQLLSSHASQSVEYICSSQAQKKTEDLRLVGFDGEKRSLGHKTVNIQNDECQLASLEVWTALYLSYIGVLV